ncbi:MAG: enoyl-CoA hydratase-related protein [Sandaracinaceae bacterium]|nr:enoyl-CoA hydratase-related protein [Sandaracinaceae bacterium]
MSEPFHFADHDLVPGHAGGGQVRYEPRPVRTPAGTVAEGLHAAWITLDNPTQFNSYTTQMVKDVILAFRRASNARDVVAVVFTGAGDKAFCTGATPRSTRSTTPAGPRSTRSTCASSTTWSRGSSPATSR